MRLLRTAALAAALGGAALAASACSGASAPAGVIAEGQEATAGWNQIIANQPVPVFKSSVMRATLIQVEAIQALGTPTTTFFYPPGGGPASSKPFKSCPSLGEPIPNTAQLDNPTRIVPDPNNVNQNNNPGSIIIDQGDPNGVYAPTASSGTNVLCLNKAGKPYLAYWEGEVYTQSGTVVYDAKSGELVQVGPDQLPVCSILIAKQGDHSGVKAGKRYYHCVKASAGQ